MIPLPTETQATAIGPILFFRRHDADRVHLAALVGRPDAAGAPGPLLAGGAEIGPRELGQVAGLTLWRFDFALSPEDRGYHFEGQDYPVVTDLTGDMRIAFVSCNGEENGDLDRDAPERNAMWDRLAAEHAENPFALMLQGGDQIYADEVTQDHVLTEDWPDYAPDNPTPAQLEDLRAHLRQRFAERYLMVLGAEAYARIAAQVPSLSVWDDHDICDGWGSLADDLANSAVGQTLFDVAREMYLLFQHAATEADIPDLFMDPHGTSLGWVRHLPDLTLIGPDLRSERTRRRIMGPAGWEAFDALEPREGQTIMVSSVPLLGPRLSLIERLLQVIPKMQHYEDDLRDQWQSRAHRAEWRRMLRAVLRLREAGPLTVVSGEIHVATRAEMLPRESLIHQLVASGISHRAPPKAYGRALGMLAYLGEAPLKEHPIRNLFLPGQKQRYISQRNYLTLDRKSGRWQAVWNLEESGRTPPLALSE
ncbi:alkaline phosphatase D family protein [uncultured Paracoccus sp.]|uniref:alkaline phosphatase D family protein n=1 Tax=uncultured Paracoccus sp. TaxID=189685 RepID=UPI00260AEA57|nr:alkaline phosphatase D family protein [uncultured Paracoccus sp.]